MNRILQYKVARLPFRVIFQDETNSESLLPSFAPFQTELTDEQLCFTLVVNDSSLPKERGKEIGQFDSGGNNHGVYRTGGSPLVPFGVQDRHQETAGIREKGPKSQQRCDGL